MSPNVSVVHVGPDPAEPGGVPSVIAMLREHEIGGAADVVVSWVPGSRAARLQAFARALVRVARLPSGTIVHVHMAAEGSIARKAVLLRVAKLGRRPTAMTVHGSRFEASSARRPRLTKRALRAADLVLVLSPQMLEIVKRLVPEANVKLFANPVVADAAPSRAGDRPPVVVFAGEVGKRKGVDVLSRAWPLVRAAVPDAQLILAGPHTELDVPPAPGLSLVGAVSRAEVRTLLRSARVVALPSRAEALPMVLLEAMGTGTPFVATNVGDIRRLTGAGAGTLIDVDDHEVLATALMDYLNHPDLATRVGKIGHRVCQDEFSISGLHEKTAAFYAAIRPVSSFSGASPAPTQP